MLNVEFIHPKFLLTWILILFMRIGVFIPFKAQVIAGKAIGRMMHPFMHKLRSTAYSNISHCFPEKKQPQGMLVGFQKFRKNTNFQHEVINTLENRILEKGEVYLVLDDQNLIVLIKKMRDQRLVLGKDIGIISYNETLLKEIVEGGITTISTDFKEMGKRLAQMIINRERFLIENPNDLIIRNSL